MFSCSVIYYPSSPPPKMIYQLMLWLILLLASSFHDRFLKSSSYQGVVQAFRRAAHHHEYRWSRLSSPWKRSLRRSLKFTPPLSTSKRREGNLFAARTSETTTNAHRPYTAVMIVPTGVGASIGGFAGDALPAARLLASVADRVITHPNVMNGAMLYWPNTDRQSDRLLYVEGNALNEFAKGKLLLQCLNGRRGQKIGVILDRGIEEKLYWRHLQVCNAMKATLGVNVHQIVRTSQPVGVKTMISPQSGASWGTIENAQTLIEAAQVLKTNGCTAIAVIARFPEEEPNSEEALQFDAYRKGEGVDSIAGVESLISHIISQEVGLPCAHAPAFSAMEVEKDVSPKACAEELGYTFLPCVLANLHRTPNLIPIPSENDESFNNLLRPHECIHANDIDAVVVPFNALGGPAVLSLLGRHHQTFQDSIGDDSITSSYGGDRISCVDLSSPLIIAVEDNQTSMNVTAESFPKQYWKHILRVRSYAEAAGYIAAHKEGIQFESLTSHVSEVPIIEL